MSTTTIRIEDELKGRVAAVADRSGKTAHAFILDAIEQTVEQAELDDDFHRLADSRWAALLATGRTVAWDDVKQYIEGRARGERVTRPAARRLTR